jgi:DNA-binding NarL/FixJ family response regulator
MSDVIKVLLVDDHTLLRNGIVSMLKGYDDIEIVGEAGSGEEAINKVEELSPQVVLMDILMGGMSGIEATRWIKEMDKEIKVIFVTMEVGEENITNAIKNGGNGYLPKDVTGDILYEAIKSVYSGQDYFSESISKIVFNSFHKKSLGIPKVISKGDKLSTREIEVLTLIADGMPNKQIADGLFISIRTVDAHRNHILKKLDLKTTADLVKYAIKNGLINL